MKNMIHNVIKRFTKKPGSQQELVDFILDERTINAAARGSMEKRNKLLDRVNLEHKHA